MSVPEGSSLRAQGNRVNLGFMYVRGAAAVPGGGVSSVLWDMVRRLRLFTEDEVEPRHGRDTAEIQPESCTRAKR